MLCKYINKSALRAELKRTMRIGVPLVGAQLLQMGNGLVDAIVAGRLGRAELAAAGVGSSLWFVTSLACIGLMAGLSPTLSRLIGQRRQKEVGVMFRQGLWLALATGLFALLVLILIWLTLPLFPFAENLSVLARNYLAGAMWSLPFVALIMAARNVCEAASLTRPVLMITGLGLLINTLANLALGLGWFGFPRLELLGIGLATTLVNLSMAVTLFLLLKGRRFGRFALFTALERPAWNRLRPLLVLSVPIFLGMLFEAGLFVATSLHMGVIGVLESGAHQIAISAAAFCFMLPLGMSFAVTARMGKAAAQGKIAPIYLRVVASFVLLCAMAFMTASLLILFRFQIAGIYTNDPDLQRFAGSLLLLGAVFQLSDGAQILLIGILRGLHDTRVPMLINAFSYWAIAFGFGLICAHVFNLGAHGLWLGLIVGLTVASILLAMRLRWQIRQIGLSMQVLG